MALGSAHFKKLSGRDVQSLGFQSQWRSNAGTTGGWCQNGSGFSEQVATWIVLGARTGPSDPGKVCGTLASFDRINISCMHGLSLNQFLSGMHGRDVKSVKPGLDLVCCTVVSWYGDIGNTDYNRSIVYEWCRSYVHLLFVYCVPVGLCSPTKSKPTFHVLFHKMDLRVDWLYKRVYSSMFVIRRLELVDKPPNHHWLTDQMPMCEFSTQPLLVAVPLVVTLFPQSPTANV